MQRLLLIISLLAVTSIFSSADNDGQVLRRSHRIVIEEGTNVTYSLDAAGLERPYWIGDLTTVYPTATINTLTLRIYFSSLNVTQAWSWTDGDGTNAIFELHEIPKLWLQRGDWWRLSCSETNTPKGIIVPTYSSGGRE